MLCRVVNVCSKVVEERQANVCDLYACRVVPKARMIASDNSHVLAQHYELLPSGSRSFPYSNIQNSQVKEQFYSKFY